MDSSLPKWASSTYDEKDDEESPVLADDETSGDFAVSFSTSKPSGMSPSSRRTFIHRVYRLFKLVAIISSLLLLVAQGVSLVYLPWDAVELVLKIFVCSFSVLVMLNELEWWGMLIDSRLLWNWLSRGYFYVFVGIVSLEENDVKTNPSQSLSAQSLIALAAKESAALFVETSSLMVASIGVCYILFGLCCGQHYLAKVRKEYEDTLTERKTTFDHGLRLSKQMIT